MTPLSADPPAPRTERSWHWAELAAVVLLGGLLLFAIVRLWSEWLHNPDLSHGLITPLVFVILLREIVRDARSDRSTAPREIAPTLLVAGAGVAGLLVFFGANLYAAALEWTHSLVLFLLGIATGILVWTTLKALAFFRFARLPAWPLTTAGLIWVLSAPIPPGTYSRLTQSLQGWISASVLNVLHLFGVAAERIGNVITLAHVSVGVEEACSGVRSLISCLFAALFLSAAMARRPLTRALLIAASIPLAIGMNFIRSLILTLLANDGVDIEGFWHDATGYAILAVTALLLVAIARALEPPKKSVFEKEADVSAGPRQSSGSSFRRTPLAIANALLLCALGLWLLFTAKTRPHPSAARTAIAPVVDDLIPKASLGWTVSTRDDLYQFSAELRTRFLAERSFTRTVGGAEQQITIYVAFWPAGQVPVSLVEAHTPDACWPGGGWVENAARHRRLKLQSGARTLPPGEFRSFQLQSYPQNVWYWHLFDGQVIEAAGASSPRQLLSLAWHYGFRKDGNQYFVRISSNLPWERIADEPLMQDALVHLQLIGL